MLWKTRIPGDGDKQVTRRKKSKGRALEAYHMNHSLIKCNSLKAALSQISLKDPRRLRNLMNHRLNKNISSPQEANPPPGKTDNS